MRTFGRLEWPVRTVSFSHDSAFIASGSEDPQVDIADVETSRQVGFAPRFTEASRAHASHACACRSTRPVFGTLHSAMHTTYTLQVHSIPCSAPMNSVSWHPTRHLLAYAGDDKNKSGQDEGSLRVFGFS